MSQIIPLLVFAVAGVLFYIGGTPTRRQQVSIPFAQELAQDAAAAERNTN
jgi:hypothetical protein